MDLLPLIFNKHSALYTAADIEKYHQGQLTPAQMHAMERAALEDPFLADALEGYGFAGADVSEDMRDLQARLEQRLQEHSQAPVVPLPPSVEPARQQWWKIAAAVVVLLGVSWGIFQWTADPHTKENISQAPAGTDKALPSAGSDSGVVANNNELADTAAQVSGQSPVRAADSLTGHVPTETNAAPPAVMRNDIASSTANPSRSEALALHTDRPTDTSSPVPQYNREAEDRSIAYQQNRSVRARADEEAKSKQRSSLPAPKKEDTDKGLFNTNPSADSGNNFTRQFNRTDSSAMPRYFVFRGKVLDDENNPLPFTNITNQKDQVGTYADANGNFVLISTDSVLNVQVRSIGFAGGSRQLKEKTDGNKLILHPDQNLATRVLDTSYRVVNLARLNGSLRHEEPEPVDGWIKYDTYVANNLKIPDDVSRPKLPPAATVELSFEVDKMGQPVNIKVVRSLCGSCDQEAIRLVREGPKWKPTKRKKRTTVTISFDE